MHRRPRLRGTVPLAALLVAGALAGCSGGEQDPAADPTAAPQGGSPACAQVLDRAPQRVLDQPRAAAGAPVQGVLVWGSPGILLRCGLDETGPTTSPCLTVDGVDWVLDDPGEGSDAPLRFTTYGRTPQVEVLVPASYGRENASGALVDLRESVAPLPQGRECVGLTS